MLLQWSLIVVIGTLKCLAGVENNCGAQQLNFVLDYHTVYFIVLSYC